LKVTVVGLGPVGQVAAAGLAKAGHDVLGVDISRQRICALQGGEAPIFEPGLHDLIREAASNAKLRFLHNEDVAEHLGDVVLIATGTPPSDTGAADLSQVRSALEWATRAQPDTLVVMKSTVPPGTGTRFIEGSATSVRYVSNPEFLREGHAVDDWFHPDRIVVGTQDTDAAQIIRALHQGIDAPFIVTDITSAEMIKYASNAFLATKISFINEIASLCDRVGASIDDVSDGIAMDPRIGASSMKAGIGYGGSCFPKDVRALDYLALTNGYTSELLRSVITVNNRQRMLPLQALRERFIKLSGLKVGVLGLAFKPDTDDIREAPSLDLINVLVGEGADVSAYDPVAHDSARGSLPSSVRLVDDILDAASGTQALVVATEWKQIVNASWDDVYRCMRPPRFLFDGRNALDPHAIQALGFEYQGVGRSHHTTARTNGDPT
jgi:UDPglucose 6-dehydrogenase